MYRTGDYVLLDFETTNLDKGSALNEHNSTVLAVWYTSWNKEWHYCFGDEFRIGDQLTSDLEHCDFLIAHNAKFEAQWLVRCGARLQRLLVYDTLLAEYVIGGNRWQFGALGLDRIAQRRWGEGKSNLVSRLIKSGVCPSDIPQGWLLDYCEQDCKLTLRLFEEQLKELDDALLGIVYSRCLVTPVLADIETAGLKLDEKKVYARLEELEKEQAQVVRDLNAITGPVNYNSPKQVSALLYDKMGFSELSRHGKPLRTPAGGRKTDADTILLLKATTKEQKQFVELFGKVKATEHELKMYIRKFADCCKHDGGILYASINQSSTQTHRFSSSGAKYRTQIQNIDRSLKPMFTARNDGWLVAEADGSQLEFRVAGHLGRDRAILEDLLAKRDVHSATAQQLGTSRQDAKPFTFKPLYGGRSGTPKERAYYEYFRTRYAGITAAQDKWINEVLVSGKLRTEWGLVFYWPGTTISSSGYVSNSTSICNYPVQSFATADIIPISLVHFWHRCKVRGLRLRLVNTVHDSIIAEVPPEEIEEFYDLARQCFIDDVYPFLEKVYKVKLTVPLGCEVVSGTHWGIKGNERKYEAGEHLYV